jgi:cobalt/nickel transport system permease protein
MMLLSVDALHIPDGFLSITVSLLAWVISIFMIGYALRIAGKGLDERQVPMMGLLAAAIFAGQMINFAVAGGTSGHLMGAALATILMGPWPAILIMTSVVSIQALIFQDGGLLVLGANIFNMAIVGVAVAHMVYTSIKKIAGDSKKGILLGGFGAGWLSVLLAALSVALQLVISGTSPAKLAIPAMASVHLLIGIGEGLITVGALAFLLSVRQDLIQPGRNNLGRSQSIWGVGFILTVVLILAAPLASTRPDGLEWVASQVGFIERARSPIYELVPEYLLPGVENESLATILAGALGVIIVFGLGFGIAFNRWKSQLEGN